MNLIDKTDFFFCSFYFADPTPTLSVGDRSNIDGVATLTVDFHMDVTGFKMEMIEPSPATGVSDLFH
jgi:hypothetical protein